MKKPLWYATFILMLIVSSFTLKAQSSNQSQNAQPVLDWVNQTITESFTFNYTNYAQVIAVVSPKYSKQAYQSLLNYLKITNDINAMINHRYSLSVSFAKNSMLVSQGVVNGNNAWNVQLYLKLSFENDKKVENVYQNILINAQVVNSPAPDTDQIFMIQEIEFKEQMAPF
ncbi:MAG: DotI/IcmL family type IV secretion protein [Proteobacteria bacterium]|nr:DotI/IcmL family type IV secretion protein [Pseudomonadota bacterium]